MARYKKTLTELADACGERSKQEAWRELRATAKGMALLRVIESHFFRSLRAWGASDGKKGARHGSFTEYVGAWLRANGAGRREQQAVRELEAIFPPPVAKGLGRGMSYWGVEKDWGY